MAGEKGSLSHRIMMRMLCKALESEKVRRSILFMEIREGNIVVLVVKVPEGMEDVLDCIKKMYGAWYMR